MRKSILYIMITACTLLSAAGQNNRDDILRAVSLSERGKSDEAAVILKGMDGIESNFTLLLLRGDILLRAGRTGEAKNDFMAAEQLQQGSGLYGLARCAAAGGDARAAVAYLESHLRSQQRRGEPEILLDSAFSNISSSAEWKSLWKKEWYRVSERKSWEIQHYLKSGRTDMAAESWEELASLYPELAVTDYLKARIMMAGGKYNEAARIIAGLTEGDDTPPEWRYTLAQAYEGAGEWYAAAAAYGKLIDAGHPDPKLLFHRSRMLLKSGDRQAAKRDLERYLSIDPDDTDVLGLIGKTYAEEGAIYEALPYLNANVDKHPGEATAFNLRGDAWLAARSWERAAEDYAMGLDLNPENGMANLNMGIALVNSGRIDLACHYLRKARALGEKTATQYLSKHCIK
jgi:predicted Zn-dependent protease